jgi:tight adherence protein B
VAPINRRGAFLLAASLTLLASAPHRAWAGETGSSVRIRTVDVSLFPSVTLTVSAENASQLTPDKVKVTEDGKSVSPLTIKPLEKAGTSVDVVLALDVSGSMKGGPLGSAIAAALKFVTKLPANRTRVGIVTFSDHPRVVQPLTADRSRVLQSLGSLQARGETALYDAVATATRMFTGSTQRNLIVLSDGKDTASKAKLKTAVVASRSRHVAVFSVGLQSSETDIGALKKLADRTDGSYSPAKTADLSSVYSGLATQLSHQFVVTYKSKSTSGGQATIAVTAPGGTDNALALFPKVAPPPPPPAPPEAPSKPLLGGTVGLLVVLVFSFVALFLLLTMALGARSRARQDRELIQRMAASPEPLPEESDGGEGRGIVGLLPQAFVRAGEKMASAGGFTERVELALERAGLPLRAGEYVSAVGLAGLAGAIAALILLRNPIFVVLIAGATTAIPIVWLKMKIKRRSNKLHGQLADILMILASSLRAGHGFFQSVDLVAKEIGEPGSQEFGRVVAEVRLGRNVDEALNAMAERVGSDDFKWAVLGVNVQREVGGNLAEVLDTVADTVRERDAVRRQIRVLSAEGRLSIGILACLPFFVTLYIAKVNPGYLNLLFSTRIGQVMVATAACLEAVGIFWMKKIVNIDV